MLRGFLFFMGTLRLKGAELGQQADVRLPVSPRTPGGTSEAVCWGWGKEGRGEEEEAQSLCTAPSWFPTGLTAAGAGGPHDHVASLGKDELGG